MTVRQRSGAGRGDRTINGGPLRMSGHGTYRAGAYTLIEIILVVGLLVALSAMAIPNFVRQIERERLPGSVRQLRSLLTLVRANAAFDGKRYRFRFPTEDEQEALA